jgi:hypothetical protein
MPNMPKVIVMEYEARINYRDHIELLDKGTEVPDKIETTIEELNSESIRLLVSDVGNYNIRQDQVAKATQQVGTKFKIKRATIQYEGD